MASHDVQVKEVDEIRTYNRKFGDFLVSFTEHLSQFQHSLQKRLDDMAQAKMEIKQERVKIDDEIRQARAKYQDSYNHGSYKIQHRSDGSTYSTFIQDQAYINKCRSEFEHLDGHVYHEAKLCEELVHSKLMQSTQAVNLFIQQSEKLKEQFRNYVFNGRVFLDKSAQFIEQYKDSKCSD